MSKLLFKNKDLLPVFEHNSKATTFNLGWAAYEKYERETGKEWDYAEGDIPAEYQTTTTETLFLVKDSGIYLMAGASNLKVDLKKMSHVCYADGYSANSPSVWERARQAVGGDDFSETIEITKEIRDLIVLKGASILINFKGDSLTLSCIK